MQRTLKCFQVSNCSTDSILEGIDLFRKFIFRSTGWCRVNTMTKMVGFEGETKEENRKCLQSARSRKEGPLQLTNESPSILCKQDVFGLAPKHQHFQKYQWHSKGFQGPRSKNQKETLVIQALKKWPASTKSFGKLLKVTWVPLWID